MIRHILENCGIKTGLIGTIQNGWEDCWQEASHTTPESIDIQELMAGMAEAGCKAVVMEVSSQGLKFNRVDEVDFDIGLFTNLSADHIGRGEHENYEEYRYWKSTLFERCHRAVVNIDSREWPQMIGNADLEQVIFCGRNKEADFRIGSHRLWRSKGKMGVEYLLTATGPCGDGKTRKISLEMPGEFNIENSAMAIAVTRAVGMPWDTIKSSLEKIKIPGRVEMVPFCDDFAIMVDYAHNGVALESLLKSMREYNPARLITVFGCGGDRDVNRRFEMGKAASAYADLVIVTSDNPRSENPQKIMDDIISAIPEKEKVIARQDRRSAISCALQEAKTSDIIIIAGKGHETYQIIGKQKNHFDDREEILRLRKEKI